MPDEVYGMIEARASKSFAAQAHARVSVQRAPLLTWLNLVGLDAPLVAIAWQWLFAHSFDFSVKAGATAALFLTAWVIYLADRWGDSCTLHPHGPASLRQRFCLRHRAWWVRATMAIAAVDLVVVCTALQWRTFLAGAAVGFCPVVYLSLNRLRPSFWRTLPLKESTIGLLFAAGTIVSLADSVTGAIMPAWLLLVSVCSLNCICIAFWERELDAAQRRISIATAFPRSARHLPAAFFVVTMIGAGCALFATPPGIYACLVGSALLLAVLLFFQRSINPDTRTALADLALLTPVVGLLTK